ncbi:bifunctional DNA-formamidopyrimidine glycosylase/DNA-(apurinic or apyrimidinic site) lyase [Legionella taurinensis]|uniref:Formamidopyrimidine-DNA glycosylase n=1 Tax=Legionella taurinensis TaxID=70611 RepID=A0A3A5L6I5_9GAMM|nr:bifunctional DNA-formamidopyrimidine glycosylase/DNA-(apurinic or apyrimidinic site) lyase [Legionella taurinensis]MDX1837862.1 bifunctional DNA-formamidopyrimidine glycosylase/DNA-(apurinic or apyrimidinic site) lyase [Legionella taurinensis]PUT39636.1 DNA-formamidopyrimidine glycosylase [Legionella taurinensis]PUT43331.1 DNA-formamidopyrimidine glycosylase [Legionella taurinensis]PUT45776.1 DNA-formamidopyrimidine glycosylase [Legionella taurinensis]PUT47688.1 DNA-formamidopyrimidine glyc
MPELPEVETTKEGIKPFLMAREISGLAVRDSRLRKPVPPQLAAYCIGKKIIEVSRRAKYILIHLEEGYLLIHLGMTGHLRLLKNNAPPPKKHDHIDLLLTDGGLLRYNDPRRFGLWLYLADAPDDHPLFRHLGPEPLSEAFHGDYLFEKAKRKTQTIKSFIMDNRIVVGVGNIYATESLFLAGLHPFTPAGRVSREQFNRLSLHIQAVLRRAIEAGGTTLRDFYDKDGKPGYFTQKLQVYGRKNQPCFHCRCAIEVKIIGGRSSAFCPQCQPVPAAE